MLRWRKSCDANMLSPWPRTHFSATLDNYFSVNILQSPQDTVSIMAPESWFNRICGFSHQEEACSCLVNYSYKHVCGKIIIVCVCFRRPAESIARITKSERRNTWQALKKKKQSWYNNYMNYINGLLCSKNMNYYLNMNKYNYSTSFRD